MSLLCTFGLHDLRLGPVQSEYTTDIYNYVRRFQHGTCLRCGKVRERTINVVQIPYMSDLDRLPKLAQPEVGLQEAAGIAAAEFDKVMASAKAKRK